MRGEWTLYRRLLAELRPHLPLVAATLLLSLLASPLALLTPLPLKIAVDSALGGRPLPAVVGHLVPASARSSGGLLALAAVLLVAVALLSQLQDLAESLLSTYTGERIVLGLRSRLFHHVQRLSLGHADARGSSDAVYRILYDAPALQQIAIEGVIPFATSAVTVVAMLAVAARLDWQLALVGLTVAPLLFAVSKSYRGRLRRRSREVKELERSALAIVQEVLGALRVVKAFGQEDREQRRFLASASQGMGARIRLVVAEGGFGLLVGLITAAGSAAVLYVGVRHVQSGVLTLGALLLLLGYVAQLYGPLKTMSRKAASLQSRLASVERAFELLDEEPEVVQRPGARRLARAAGRVSFRGVCFAYEPGRPALHDVSFDVAPGTRVAITGPTGAGKTTLASLLLRLYDPQSGAVLLDGVDLRDYDLADLRSQFAVVLQDSVLFSASVAENIAYARPAASARDIVAAATAAGAHDFVSRLPAGYATQVGERGMMVSGGERQRIALARAFLKDAPLLILDEPTSSLDPRTESAILDAIDRLARGRTTLLVSHRESALEVCQVRVELDHGRVAHRGLLAPARAPFPVRSGAAGRAR